MDHDTTLHYTTLGDSGNRNSDCDSRPHRAPRSLYIHVPFCRAKCTYCNFYSRPFEVGRAEGFVTAATMELAARSERLETPLESVFVGGGTPTVLGGELLGRLLRPIGQYVDENTEFTVEANPDTMDSSLADILVAEGVNRVTLGVQSFQAAELRLLGRTHSADRAGRVVGILRKAGLRNLGLDVIYGIPGQTAASWRDTLCRVLALSAEHLSCYALSFEAGTALERDRLSGRLRETEDSFQRDCYEAVIAASADAGMEHYGISNFAAAGRLCRHNLTCWRNRPYLGIGPDAASYLEQVRSINTADTGAYVSAVSAGHPAPADSERLTGRPAMAEAVMLGLRLIQGIDRTAFRACYGQDPIMAFPRSTTRYAEIGALIVTESHVRLAGDSLFVADAILSDILAEA